MHTREKTLTIRTPEGIEFPLVIASPVSRFLALIIDQVCIITFVSVIGVVAMLLGSILFIADLAMAFVMLAFFAVAVGYAIVLEWFWRGRTVGKKMMKLRVMDSQGLRLQFSQVVIRNLVRIADMLPALYLVGGAAAFLSPRGQRLGDLAANTIVVSERTAEEPDLDTLLPDKFNSFREHPHLAARLRQNVTPREAGLAVEALLRRDRLDETGRLQLFADLRRHFETKVRFPPEATDGISDERYVRNVVDIVFR